MISQPYKMKKAALVGAAFLFIFMLNALPMLSVNLLDPNTINKWRDTMPTPAWMPNIGTSGDTTLYHIGMYPVAQYYHADFPVKTKMWAYGEDSAHAQSPAKTILSFRNHPIKIHWTNNLVDSLGVPLKHPIDIDRTIPWADVLGDGPHNYRYDGPVPTVVHMHGAEVEPGSDGHYASWFTPDVTPGNPGYVGESYYSSAAGQNYIYANKQRSALIWFHDHAFGIDRMNVMMGLFGGHAIVDLTDPVQSMMPTGDGFDLPVIIQDRQIDENYQIAYTGQITNPDVHPIWFPEFFGNIIVVNGKIWPYKNVEPRKYRLRFLDGSNARFYSLYFADSTKTKVPGFQFMQIATDDGFLPKGKLIDSILFAPGERFEIIVDFTQFAGQTVYLMNNAAGPYPGGSAPDSNLAQILRFNVAATVTHPFVGTFIDTSTVLKPTPTQPAPILDRYVVLYENEGPGGPLAMFLDGMDMSDPRSVYRPTVGTVERWHIINTTMDHHPMHWHLVQSQLLYRHPFRNYNPDMSLDTTGYLYAYKAANKILPLPYDSTLHTVDVTPFYSTAQYGPTPTEDHASKDTWICPTSEESVFLIKWEPEDGGVFPFDASESPGYVFHCHILEHEENAMMREVQPRTAQPPLPSTSANMCLWLDAKQQQATGPVNYTNMMPMINHWTDQSGKGNTAVQMDMRKMPMHKGYGMAGFFGVDSHVSPVYGESGGLSIPYSSIMTTDHTDFMHPFPENKSLFVVFKPNSLTGRQTIFEAGGTQSGFNVYIDNGYVIFGMWNRLEKRFVKDLTPLVIAPNKLYLAHLEYNEANQQFRAIVSHDNNGQEVSPIVSFMGLTKDSVAGYPAFPSGVGCESGGTRYHDYAIGNDLARSFDGVMGDIMLYNSFFSPSDAEAVYGYLRWDFNNDNSANWHYPVGPQPRTPWVLYEETESPAVIAGEQHLLAPQPNPFSDKSEFTVALAARQNVNVELYNNFGDKVSTIFNGSLPKGGTNLAIDGTNLTPGMYVIRATGDGFVESAKIVFVK